MIRAGDRPVLAVVGDLPRVVQMLRYQLHPAGVAGEEHVAGDISRTNPQVVLHLVLSVRVLVEDRHTLLLVQDAYRFVMLSA